ncbi:MAG TPA: T9SS type A sorting domain-containing protein [Chitinophagales bacterium]|nr:T9SS type A sorting domain-containing protein [Chitinophagales bacterium]
MRLFTLLLFFAIILPAQAQKTAAYMPASYKTGTCKATYPKVKLAGTVNIETVSKYLQSTLPNLNDEHCSLQLNYQLQSIGGVHFSFTQLYNGVAVYQSEIKVNLDRQNIIRSVFDNSYDTRQWNVDVSSKDANSVIAIDPKTNEPVLAEKSIVNHRFETLTANGTIIFQTDNNCYFLPPDSTVTGLVFNPDPLTTSGNVYGGMYINNGDSDAAWLTAEQQSKSFKANYSAGTFTLQSSYVQVTQFNSTQPDTGIAISANGLFNFTRSQPQFKDVNAFYHLSTYQSYIHHLGFNCADGLVQVDPHAFYDDNSYFSDSYNPHRIYYGTGGVPDAEDADVLVHEYGHSLSWNAAPNSNQGGERRALDEAFGDYNAASYSKSINTFNDQWVFNWDGHNDFWPGRIMNSTHVYPTDLDGSIYDNGELWSAVIFSLNGDLGRGIADSLIIETHYSYAQNISMADAAQLLLDADTVLFNGAYFCPIFTRLYEHGFVTLNGNTCGLGIDDKGQPNNYNFWQHGHSFTLIQPGTERLQIWIYNIAGQQVQPTINNANTVYNYSNNSLAPGLYLVRVTGSTSVNTFKWLNTGQ